jgi:hypothetical protein
MTTKKHEHEKPAAAATPALTIGQIVPYTLSEADALAIAAQRVAVGVLHRIGSTARGGDVYPMIIVRVLPTVATGQVFLDGNDSFWASIPKS